MCAYLTTEQRTRAEQAVSPALTFLDGSGYAVGAALVRHRWQDGGTAEVLDALSQYQQPDGGFAGLEVDIKAPVSTAFDGRLAMQVLLGLRERPDTALTQRLGAWYSDNQHADGDWHFPADVYQHELAPWFAEWEFPGLNPSCSIAGLTHALGIATLEMLELTARIWQEKATLDAARSGDFYSMLPLIEYVAHIEIPDRETWWDALAAGIEHGIATDAFPDAEHALEHIVGGGPEVAARIDRDVIITIVDRVLPDQLPDGGWPTPYDDAWRPWVTSNMLALLSRLQELQR